MKIKISSLDKLFSQYIRSKANWTCERCHRQYKPPTKSLHTSHFWGRAKKSTRFDPDNVASLCFGCHLNFTAHPAFHRDWFFDRLGAKRFNALMLRANTPKKPDYAMILLWLKSKLKEMNK